MKSLLLLLLLLGTSPWGDIPAGQRGAASQGARGCCRDQQLGNIFLLPEPPRFRYPHETTTGWELSQGKLEQWSETWGTSPSSHTVDFSSGPKNGAYQGLPSKHLAKQAAGFKNAPIVYREVFVFAFWEVFLFANKVAEIPLPSLLGLRGELSVELAINHIEH